MNLQKMPHPVKGHRIPLLFVAAASLITAPASGQLSEHEPPAICGLAGAVTARHASPWHAMANPAGLRPDSTHRLSLVFVPVALGMDGYHEGGALYAPQGGNAYALAFYLGGSGIPGYREMSGAALVAFPALQNIHLGACIEWGLLAIERYGTAWTANIDVGAQAELSGRINAGIAITNLLRNQVAGTELPQRLRAGFAFALLDSTWFSLDASHELGRASDVAVGISTPLGTNLELHGGLGSIPSRLACGIRFQTTACVLEYGGCYVAGLGLRHAAGITIEWK